MTPSGLLAGATPWIQSTFSGPPISITLFLSCCPTNAICLVFSLLLNKKDVSIVPVLSRAQCMTLSLISRVESLLEYQLAWFLSAARMVSWLVIFIRPHWTALEWFPYSLMRLIIHWFSILLLNTNVHKWICQPPMVPLDLVLHLDSHNPLDTCCCAVYVDEGG